MAGWQPVALGPTWQIVRAEAGTVPLYTDDDAEAETLSASRTGAGWAALVCALAAVLLFALQGRLAAQGNEAGCGRENRSPPWDFSTASARASPARATSSRSR